MYTRERELTGDSPELEKKVSSVNEQVNGVEDDEANLMDKSAASITKLGDSGCSLESRRTRGEHDVADGVLRLPFRPN